MREVSARSNAMHIDARGLPISTASANAAAAFDHLIAGYLTQRADTPDRLQALLQADPDFALAHCMKGYFAMLAFKQASVPVAVEEARTAQSLAAGATPRERSHIAALSAWSEGELDRALATWESILRAHPLDVVAFRLAHFVNFWLGRPQDMVSSAERVIAAWSEDPPVTRRCSPASPSRTRKPGAISRPSPSGAAPSNSTPAISGPRMPSRT
jgi:hypothetical protein